MSNALDRGGTKDLGHASPQIAEVRTQLTGEGAINFSWILETLIEAEASLSPEDKLIVAPLVLAKIVETLKGGHWNDLRGARELLLFLGMDALTFSDEWLQRVEALYKRLPYQLLFNLSPTLFNGKLWNGQKYDRNEYTREKLKVFGIGEEELTDEFIAFLWDVRELLIQMHVKRISRDTRLLLGPLLMIE